MLPLDAESVSFIRFIIVVQIVITATNVCQRIVLACFLERLVPSHVLRRTHHVGIVVECLVVAIRFTALFC